LKLTGGYREDRHGGTPTLPAGTPVRPPLPTRRRRALYRLAERRLVEAGYVGEADGLAIAALADALADWIRFGTEAEAAPTTMESVGGAVSAHPVHKLKADAWRRVMVAMGKLGLSPSDVRGLAVKAKKEEAKDDGHGSRFFKSGG
jgi:phage terminase small subunit